MPLLFAARDATTAGVATGMGVLLLASLATLALVFVRRQILGTTLVSAWWWALAATWFIALVEGARVWLGEAISDSTLEAARYAAATATFCPTMAALGAKRPQDKAWQFVVFSLWGILVLPAAEAVFLHPGQGLEIRGARSWFLFALVVVGAANSLPTRFWLSSLLAAAGQTILLVDHLPLGASGVGDRGLLLGLFLCVAALGLAAARFPRDRTERMPLDRLWLDFRDLFGALWGLRVAERVNASAGQGRWKITLSWSGFHSSDAASAEPRLSPEEAAALRQTLDNLLRRFVSPEWIEARLGKIPESP
jgi:hypothetical protein